MNKKLAAALSGGAVLVLALSACSGDESNEELDAWAKKICDTATAPNEKIAAADAAINKVATDSEPEELQRVDSQSFGDLSEGFQERATHLRDAGAPPGVDDGEKTQQDAIKKLTAVSTAYADLKKQVDALDTKDQAKFASGLSKVSDGMTDVVTLRKNAVTALEKLEEGEAKSSLVKQESCRSASASAPATDS
ncbi:small secreted protein [Streptomyces blattellae]|uniref:small secreted protein n=1 Tax=Streptomyces blattellae TaxID=2569855 RepID=UPI001E442E2F|nr:small secreted protein [Streptomyces blattellae]